MKQIEEPAQTAEEPIDKESLSSQEKGSLWSMYDAKIKNFPKATANQIVNTEMRRLMEAEVTEF